MKKTLHFSTTIHAPREKVWETMLSRESYRDWTSVFSPGSDYVGSWEEGTKIQFTSPEGDGLSSVIEKANKPAYISIRHVGWIKNGVEDFDSESVKNWVPAYENYTFTEHDGQTTLDVDMDVTEEDEKGMKELWPKSLQRLKRLCER